MLCKLSVLAAIPALAHAIGNTETRSNWIFGNNFGVAGDNVTYDYVVVGGGTAGNTIATRLAQSGQFSVAVVEAGGFYEIENGNLTQIPTYSYRSAGPTLYGVNPLIDWRFSTTVQPNAGNRAYHYPRGKTLGGCSARNYMLYQRPTVGSMDKWASLVNDQSYTFSNTLPFYKKSVKFTAPGTVTRPSNVSVDFDAGAYDTAGGPLQVSYSNYLAAFSSWAQKGLSDIGIPINKQGVNSGKLLGHSYGPTVTNPADQTRSSSEQSFLNLALSSTNLMVHTKAFVQRILFDGSKKATGVLVETDGVQYTITAKREVIVSAGAFQSPQLLMVSGIGPQSTLRANGIPVLADRPGVGKNLMDNIFFGPNYELNLETSAHASDPRYRDAVVSQFNNDKNGVLTNNNADYVAYEKLSNKGNVTLSNSTRSGLIKNFPADWPEVEYFMSIAYLGMGYGPPDGKNYGGMYIGLTAPTSRGTVSISSSSMKDPPVIDPAWLQTKSDQEVMVAAFKRTRQFFQQSSARNIVIGQEAYPGPNVKTDAEILSAISNSLTTLNHAACTCSMGNSSDPNAVIDKNAKVYGVTGLRVVDISSFPILVPGQPQATVYMLAEKIADAILKGN